VIGVANIGEIILSPKKQKFFFFFFLPAFSLLCYGKNTLVRAGKYINKKGTGVRCL
jgi:hypothetical protein